MRGVILTITTAATKNAWARAIAHRAREFGSTPLKVISGQIPAGLQGSLYRNGPGFLERNGQRVGHWFDGDGGILALHFGEGKANGLYRYVQTSGFVAEEKASQFLLAGYAMLPSGNWFERFRQDLKNAANTSVLAVADKLLALWEGGAPYALDLKTLATLGLDDLDGLAGATYSAHPKRDPQTGDIFNFGVTFGANATLNLYRSDATGKIQQRSQVALKGLPPIHDFVLAGRYLVFCISPVRLNALPVLARLKSYCDALEWQPKLGTEILVIDRDTLQVVSRFEADPWYQWHFGNGYELPDGSVTFSVVRYADFQTNEFLREVAQGEIRTIAPNALWQIRIDPQAGKLLEQAVELSQTCEFPVVSPAQVGQPWRYTYLNLQRQTPTADRELFGAIARFDHQTGSCTVADFGDNTYPSEPIYVADAIDPNRGWVLAILYNGNSHTSEVWIFDAANLAAEPIGRLALPEVIPPGFHGTWKAAKASETT